MSRFGTRGGQRHQRTLSLLSHEDHGGAGRLVEAAVAAATRTALSRLMPTQQAVIEADYQAALKPVPDGRAKADGSRWARGGGGHPRLVCRRRASPRTRIDPTRPPASTCRRRSWRCRTGQTQALGDDERSPLRPGPPPSSSMDALDARPRPDRGPQSEEQRRAHAAEQTAMARYWLATAPAVYWPVARSLAGHAQPRHDVKTTRLLGVAGIAMDDALNHRLRRPECTPATSRARSQPFATPRAIPSIP